MLAAGASAAVVRSDGGYADALAYDDWAGDVARGVTLPGRRFGALAKARDVGGSIRAARARFTQPARSHEGCGAVPAGGTRPGAFARRPRELFAADARADRANQPRHRK